MARKYHQLCGVARALDLVGERWTLLIVRDLMVGPLRYTDLLAALPGITTNLLAKRLRELAEIALVRKRSLKPPATGTVYELTEAGRDLEPAIFALGEWGMKHNFGRQQGNHFDFRRVMLVLRRRYKPVALHATVELRVGERRFQIRFGGDHVETAEGDRWQPDVVATGSERAFVAPLFGPLAADDLVSKSRIKVSGDLEAWGAFLDAFSNSSSSPQD